VSSLQKPAKKAIRVEADPASDCGKLVDVAVGIVLQPDPRQDAPDLGINRPFLVTRRRESTVYGGWWEFPGGKIEPCETPSAAVVRELYEEVGIDARVLARLPLRTHAYEHATVRLHPLVCLPTPGSPEPRAVEVAEWRWLTLDGLDRDTFLPANGPLLDDLRGHLSTQRD